MNKFHPIVAGALEIGQSFALKSKHQYISPYHLLWGLLNNPSSYCARELKHYKDQIKFKLKEQPTLSTAVPIDQLRPDQGLSEWLTHASGFAIQSGREEVGEKDLLRFMPQVLPELEIDPRDFADTEEESEVPSFLVNLNEMAMAGKLDPVIGRGKEIRSVMEILGRRSKNNPVLVGPAGVGKTAIVEGLAERIVKGEVPDVLKDKVVYSLDMGSLMAGTKFRGEFEERLQGLIKFIKEHAQESILFIDEIHQLVGAGKTDGAMDAANLLKPALARGELNCIGATTFDEYQKYILGDSALDRRFRSVPVLEPTIEDSVEILSGIREKLEIHHGIKISDDAIFNAVKLSDQYINDKNLPDKAIDLIDEAASALKLSAEAMPSELAELEGRIRTHKISMQMHQGDKSELESELETMETEFDKGKKDWEEQVFALKRVSELKSNRDKLTFEMEQAERTGDWERAAQIKHSLLPEVEEQIEGSAHEWIIQTSHVAQVIHRQTGIPIEKILRSKAEHILGLEDFLNTQVYGQQEPLHEVAQTLISSHAGLSDQSRPLGSFILKGPSGVGKTETAKSLARFFFGNEENLIRLDMSEYSEKHSVAKLIGAPAGYVGYEEGGVLTEAVRRRPYAILLFDEIEKAHREFSDILLQVLDDGRLTDNHGRTIDFKNTIILMTTNSQDVTADFRPEVLGRLDAILDYQTLGKEVVYKLIDKQLEALNERLQDKNCSLTLKPELVEQLVNRGYDERYGARPLNSIFNKLVVRPLSSLLLAGKLGVGSIELGWDEQLQKIALN
jgi:ATP-dependent Clp protease ATP-binding subunit ClpB